MNKRHLFLVFSIAIIFSLVAAFLIFSPALAQDETPPAEPAPEETPAEEAAPLGEMLAESGVEVVDESGEAIPLVAEALTASDPWFKVGTVTYRFLYNPPPGSTCADLYPGDLNCHESNTPLQDAVVYIRDQATIPSDGLIHVDAGTLHNQVVTIDGSNANIAKLKGISGHVNPDTLLPDTILDNTLNPGSLIFINNKLNGFTISGFQIDGDSTNSMFPLMMRGVINCNANAGNFLLQDLVTHDISLAGATIRITGHKGSVILKNVDSHNNMGRGAYIDNSDGTGGVTIIGSSFNGNPNTNLEITSKGAVIVNGITASNNTGSNGNVKINSASSVTITNGVFNNNTNSEGLTITDLTGNITLTNVYANGNKGGMTLTTKGNITLTDVSASGNAQYGADLDTCNGTLCTWLGTGKVTITNGAFNDNTKVASAWPFGLRVRARGAIALTNVSASGNGIWSGPDQKAWGGYLDTSQSLLVSPVTVNNGVFNDNYNDDAGLVIHSKGAITLTKVQASHTASGSGVILDNTAGTNAGVSIKGGVAGDNQFSDNSDYGIFILSDGPVNLQYLNLQFNNNNPSVKIDNTGGNGLVSISHAYFRFSTLACLNIDTKGSVSLSDIEANECYGIGTGGINITVHDTTAAVTLSGLKMDETGEGGLIITNRGNVTLTDVSIVRSYKGLVVDNSLGSGNVTLKNASIETRWGDCGISIHSSGAISLTNVTSFNNSGYGAKLDNTTAGSAKAVTITTGNFYENESTGLYVRSKGQITLKDVTAIGNTKNNNHIAYDQMANDVVTERSTKKWWQFNGTAGDMIDIHANSLEFNIHLSLIQKYPNPSLEYDAVGGVLEINDYIFPATCSNFVDCAFIISDKEGNDIGGYHLELIKDGGTLTDVSNLIYGADLDNTLGTAGITITGSALPADGTTPLTQGFINNTRDGLLINSHGAVTITNLFAGKNGHYGTKISNEIAMGTPAVNITNMRIFDNLGTGLHVTSKGAITLKNAASWGQDSMNDADGAYLNNSYGTAAAISITNLASTSTLIRAGFDMNGGNGLYALSNGSITLTNVNADGVGTTQSFGLKLTNNSGTSLAGVTLTACRVTYNDNAGILVNSFGTILINGGYLEGNTHAISLHNETVVDSAPKNVTINNVSFDLNANGVVIRSKGVVSLNNVLIQNLDSDEPSIDIDNSAGTAGVTLTKVKALSNQDTGIYVQSKGPVKITSCEAIQNFDNGIQVYTTGPKGTVSISSTKAFLNEPSGIYIRSESSVTISSSEASQNSGEGFTVDTTGTISISNITAKNNLTGAALYNNTSTSHANLTITGTNLVSDNTNWGLYIQSKGAVSLSGIVAENNQTGISIINSEGLGVTITKVTLRQNSSGGLTIGSDGNITLSSVVDMLNGTGIYMESNDHTISILNSVIAANDGIGIYADVGIGSLMLTNTLIFGNDQNLLLLH